MDPEALTMHHGDYTGVSVNEEPARNHAKAVKTEQGENILKDVWKNQSAEVVYEPHVPDVTRFTYDVQHGYRIFRELLADQYKSVTRPFLEPVDAEGLGLWDYYSRIETPMSFRQIESKFKSYLYQSITEIVSDMRLILENCYRYNGSNHWISKLAQKLENILDQKLALLNRSLRDKVTLHATMAFRNKKDPCAEGEELGTRRRRSGRSSYFNGMNTDQTSRLVNHLILEEEEKQKESRRLKEKERKEANEALMQELNEWEKDVYTPDVLKELQTMWEIPSVGSFLCLFREALNLNELNFTEFERGIVIPHKSRQMAQIFTALLATPNQRKSFHKKPPMTFTLWEKKLRERLDMRYMVREAEEFQSVAQIRADYEFFEILGESNPLKEKSYVDLSLHQRVLILKTLCDDCLDYEPQLRDYLGNAETTPFREVNLGHDEANCSYIYFPIFDATDIRIYKQPPLPSTAEWYRKWASTSVSSYFKSGRGSQSRSRKSGSKSKDLLSSVEEGFELVCFDVESLRALCEKFSGSATTPSGKKRRGRPTRKQSEKELHDALSSLVDELSISEGKYTKAKIKGMVNLMRDWKAPEEPSNSGNESIIQTTHVQEEECKHGDPPEVAHETPPVKETTLVKEDPNSNERRPTEEKSGDEMFCSIAQSDEPREDLLVSENPSLSCMVTRSRNKTRKRTFGGYETSTKISSTSLVEMNVGRGNSDRTNDLKIETPRTNTLSEKSDTIHDITTEYSEPLPLSRLHIDSVKADNIDSAHSEEFTSENSDKVNNVPVESVVLESESIKNGGTGQGCRARQDVHDTGMPGVYMDRTCIQDMKKSEALGCSDREDEQAVQNNGSYVRNIGILDDNGVKNVCKSEDTTMDVDDVNPRDSQDELNYSADIKDCSKYETSMDDVVNRNDFRNSTNVFQNGKCNKLEDVRKSAPLIDSHEPPSKRYCAVETQDKLSSSTKNEITGMADDSSLEASHQSPVKTALNDDVQSLMSGLEMDLMSPVG